MIVYAKSVKELEKDAIIKKQLEQGHNMQSWYTKVNWFLYY